MLAHHANAVERFLPRYRDDPAFTAILLAGSLAHGYARPNSDVDIILIATENEYERRLADKKLAFSLWDICDYEGGYVDCKITAASVMRLVAHKGSDPSRYAFKDAKVLVSKEPGIDRLLADIASYPADEKTARQHRLVCQLLAWKWYMSQAEEKSNTYLRHLATQKLALFACRTILNHNEFLCPYHKWLLEETKRAPAKPGPFIAVLEQFLDKPDFATAQWISDMLLSFLNLSESDIDWPNQFMRDSEMNWLEHEAPIDDM